MSHSLNHYKTREVSIGHLPLGSDHPVRIQSMISVPTMDTGKVVEQTIRLLRAGCEYVRITTRNIKEAAHLAVIKNELRKRGYQPPLIADVHFSPHVAEMAARIVEKVRINPGNFLPGESDFIKAPDEIIEDRIRKQLIPLLDICKDYGTALRIGSNHGSLSERMVTRYGDTPLGMVESALEFARICRDEGFHNLVISLKSSNTRIMVYSNRLLVGKMMVEGMDYPIHLGVTEAGEGEDGRIKSAIGIGTLLAEGIGDTIRVSLTEDPVAEIPVAEMIVRSAGRRQEAGTSWQGAGGEVEYRRRQTWQVGEVGGGKVPVVANAEHLPESTVELPVEQFTQEMIRSIAEDPKQVVIAESKEAHGLHLYRELFHKLNEIQCLAPVILKRRYPLMDQQELIIQSSIDLGALLIDGLGDGIWIEAEGQDRRLVDQLSYGILQGSRCRFTKTEFIACPSCGRTQFDIQETLRTIREHMGHLKNLKIAVMGCIVNGPGEMADADYGYVGAGKGKVSLYKGKTLIRRNVDEKDALAALEALIREHGNWYD